MEMITGMQIYWLTRCDAIKDCLSNTCGLIVLGIICTLAYFLVMAIASAETDELAEAKEKRKKKLDAFKKRGDGNVDTEYEDWDVNRHEVTLAILNFGRKAAFLVGGLALALYVFGKLASPFVPTTREMAAILIIPRVANSETVQDGCGEIGGLARDWLSELRPDNVKGAVRSTASTVREIATGLRAQKADAQKALPEEGKKATEGFEDPSSVGGTPK